MKYIVFSVLIASLASCSLFGTKDTTPPSNIVPVVTESGTTVASGSTTQSGVVDTSSGTVSTESGSAVTTSGTSVPPSIWPSGSTGTTVQTGATSTTEKDPEVEKITQDIDKIFDDIAREGK